MTSPLRLFWWRDFSGGRANFGDELSRWICERVAGRPITPTGVAEAELVAVGSLLEAHLTAGFPWNEYRGFVWGTGRMHGRGRLDLRRADVRAVRGRWTLERIECRHPNRVALGDPGLLVDQWIPPVEKRIRLGIVPHWTERDDPAFRRLMADTSDVRLIDVYQPVEEVLRAISSCHYILSSSLHGLIVADSLGIPNLWLRANLAREEMVGKPEFKFRDYYSVFGLDDVQPLLLGEIRNIEQIFERMSGYRRPGLAEIQRRLLNTFPMPPSRAMEPQPTRIEDRRMPSANLLSSIEPQSCVVLVPYTDRIVPQCEAGLKDLERRGYQVRRVAGFAAIDQGRNQLATDALRDGFQATMWIDSDIGFDPADVDRLRSHNQPLVCGIYPQKGKRSLACHVLPGTNELVFGEGGGLCEILYAAAGFLFVREEVYSTVKRELSLPVCNTRFKNAMVPYFQPLIRVDGDGHWYLAEDYAFCHRVRECGFTVLADTTIRLWHVGSHAFGWEDAGIDRERFGTFHYALQSQ